MNRIFFSLMMLLGLPGWAGQIYFAPDLRGDDTTRVSVGLVNPGATELTVTLWGYDSNGASLGEETVVLAARARWESQSAQLFSASASWARIDAPAPARGYVRYERGTAVAVVPFSVFSGSDLYVSALDLQAQGPRVKMVNVSAETGSASSQPQRQAPFDFNAAHLDEPVVIPGFGSPLAALDSVYGDIITGVKDGLTWDRVRAEVPMVGIQHLYEGNKGYGAMVAPATPVREMYVAPLQPSKQGFQTRFVLINTTTAPLTLTLTNYDALLPEPYVQSLVLEPGEKRSYRLGDPTSLTQYAPRWMRVTANEHGLVGYQVSESTSGAVRTFLDGGLSAGSELTFPTVRSDATHETRLTLINNTDEVDNYTVYGYDDSGLLIGSWNSDYRSPGASKEVTLREMFGTKRSQVTWLRVRSARQVVGMGLVYTLTGTSMTALEPFPSLLGKGSRSMADFEFQHATDLGPQEWTGHLFGDTLERTLFYEYLLDPGCRIPYEGSFFLETNYLADHQSTYLGYEPLVPNCRDGHLSLVEEVALVSPYVDVPEFANVYLTYALRFVNPAAATDQSRYGLVWRLEGENEWYWFGMSGALLLQPGSHLVAAAKPVCYRGLEQEVMLSPWCTMQAPLPERVAGKRIQFGIYYNHHHSHEIDAQGPRLFIDHVRFDSAPGKHSFFFPEAAGLIALPAVP